VWQRPCAASCLSRLSERSTAGNHGHLLSRALLRVGLRVGASHRMVPCPCRVGTVPYGGLACRAKLECRAALSLSPQAGEDVVAATTALISTTVRTVNAACDVRLQRATSLAFTRIACFVCDVSFCKRLSYARGGPLLARPKQQTTERKIKLEIPTFGQKNKNNLWTSRHGQSCPCLTRAFHPRPRTSTPTPRPASPPVAR
jgi:hypothetical protein